MRNGPRNSVVQDTMAVFTLGKPIAVIAALALAALLAFVLSGCAWSKAQKGGHASNFIARPGQTNFSTLTQPENPRETSRQTVQSRRTVEYLLPAGTAISLGNGEPDVPRADRPDRLPAKPAVAPASAGASATVAHLSEPMPVRVTASDRTDTSIGATQKDTAREWAAKAASLQAVMWAGIAMMTVIAAVLVYFGWWTKAALAVAVGVAMIVLAHTLPAHGTLILLAGLAVFALAALLVLYAYYKGQLDQNNNGIPDFLERFVKTDTPTTVK